MTHETFDSGADTVDQLRSYIERVERLSEEIKALNDDKSDIFREAKGCGFDVPTMKEIIRLRAKDPSERQERSALLELYAKRLGMSL